MSMFTKKLLAAVGLAGALLLGVTTDASANPWRGGHFRQGPVFRGPVYRGPVYRGPMYRGPAYGRPMYRGYEGRHRPWMAEHGRYRW